MLKKGYEILPEAIFVILLEIFFRLTVNYTTTQLFTNVKATYHTRVTILNESPSETLHRLCTEPIPFF